MRSRRFHMLVSAIGLSIGLGLLAGAASDAVAQDKKTFRMVPHSGLRITDPIITTAFISRNHGYMIYDTLFGVDDKMAVKPQMVDKYEVSGDKLTYTFTLRDGLKFHNGAPVTSADVIASLARWGTNDAMGQKLFSYTKEWKAVNDKTFQLVLKEPYGLVLDSLGKPSSQVPFIMPKAMADTPANKNVPDEIGSGPFRMVKSEFQPGVKVVYEKNPDYKPRSEPASNLSGGKVVKVDRVEWITMSDAQTATNAILKGEIDMIEQASYDLLPELKKSKDVVIKDLLPLGMNYMLRMNWLQPPLDNVKVRQAILHAIYQEDYLAAQIGNPEYYNVCGAFFGCSTPLATDAGAVGVKKPDLAKAKKMLAESGYKGEKIVIMAPTDLNSISQLPLVTTPALKAIGMNIEMQSMDWQTLVGRRAKTDPIDQGGWHIFHTAWGTADMMNPIANAGVKGLGKQGGFFGWTEDAVIEKLRDDYARETDPAKQKKLAEAVQKRAYEQVLYIPLGEYHQVSALRSNVVGALPTPALALWNIEKK
ncbi:ABC transporter substrate-binding protein [Ferrovibrio sp.]|uniref:ABC transporter substrate-binding protein n=1 Tax=Ferrovibrio sp. TaxID=1917215 RepID=UPI000CB57F5D|nr:ABC transporter substrate-binding protein [Ferrovibrio sp.]PJI41942.1 MAG: ABC transporter substrate-binding protein [Ferrovibrio sp.]